MSLMTQSLKRLAEVADKTAQRPDPPQAPEAELCALRDSGAADAGHVVTERAGQEPVSPPESKRSDEDSDATGTPRPAPARADQPRPAQRNVSAAVGKLRTAVLEDIGAPAPDAPGKLIVLIGVQAEQDTKTAAAALTRALTGYSARDVLSLNAAGSTVTSGDDSSSSTLHGFTSLIDGTRAVEEVVLRVDASSVAVIPFGLSKGSEQTVDPAAVERAAAECRSRFGFTVVNGGTWQNEYLQLIAPGADAVYLVVRANVTEQETAKQAVTQLGRRGIHARGCILSSVAS